MAKNGPGQIVAERLGEAADAVGGHRWGGFFSPWQRNGTPLPRLMAANSAVGIDVYDIDMMYIDIVISPGFSFTFVEFDNEPNHLKSIRVAQGPVDGGFNDILCGYGWFIRDSGNP